MDPIEQMERRREAQQRQRARRQRVAQLRSRVIAISVIAFVLLWGVVFAQMVAGQDPVLGSSTKRSARAASKAPETSGPVDPVEEEAQYARPPVEEEAEVIEPEVVEPEPLEEVGEEAVEVEPEPAPVITSQS